MDELCRIYQVKKKQLKTKEKCDWYLCNSKIEKKNQNQMKKTVSNLVVEMIASLISSRSRIILQFTTADRNNITNFYQSS